MAPCGRPVQDEPVALWDRSQDEPVALWAFGSSWERLSRARTRRVISGSVEEYSSKTRALRCFSLRIRCSATPPTPPPPSQLTRRPRFSNRFCRVALFVCSAFVLEPTRLGCTARLRDFCLP